VIFFTDITTEASNYCLLHVKKYHDKRKPLKTLVFVDPGVHALMKHPEYPEIELLHQLASGEVPMQPNEWVSIDYPGDMFPEKMAEFIDRTYQNNMNYAENPKYICTVQFHLSNCATPNKLWAGVAHGDMADFASFKFNLDRVLPIFKQTPSKILGIGNICRIMHPNKLLDKMFGYICKVHRTQQKFSWVHMYGLTLRNIRKYVPMLEYAGIRVSVDSTKWTRACNNELKRNFGLNCMKKTRDLYFTTYMKSMKMKVNY